ncbi:MAG: O-succinylbenzoic acid--CoA ligase [Flavobacteriales bacterium]|nr:MAG: O-succinylbenzoic acid--CoA ligase [Flavobacteriales bacterium]
MRSTSINIHPKFKLNGLSYRFDALHELALNFEESLVPYEKVIGKFIKEWLNNKEHIMIMTSGTSGAPKKINILKNQMINSAIATGAFFKLPSETKALLCLPASYIAGKMMLVRAMTLGWDLYFTGPQKDPLGQNDKTYDFVAMVPFQVRYSLKHLNKVKKLIVGGAAISEKLNEQLQHVSTEVFATYGMTETLSHVAVKAINGKAKSNYYAALPNVNFSVDRRECLVIEAPHVSNIKIITNDVVKLISSNMFEYLGRLDNVVNSGGVKLFPEQIEAKLAMYMNRPFIISSEKEEIFGYQLILIIEEDFKKELPDFNQVFLNLSKYERPKKIYTYSKFLFTETGKIRRSEILNDLHQATEIIQ